MVLRPSAPCRVVGMEMKDFGLLRGHLARDSAPRRVAGMEIKDLGLLGGHLARDQCLAILWGQNNKAWIVSP